MIQPTKDRVFAEPDKVQNITAGGLFIADTNVPQSLRLKVLAVGPGVTVVKPDDICYVGQFAPTEVKDSPTAKTVIIPEDDIIAVVVPDKSAK